MQARRDGWDLAEVKGNRRGSINRETYRVTAVRPDGALEVETTANTEGGRAGGADGAARGLRRWAPCARVRLDHARRRQGPHPGTPATSSLVPAPARPRSTGASPMAGTRTPHTWSPEARSPTRHIAARDTRCTATRSPSSPGYLTRQIPSSPVPRWRWPPSPPTRRPLSAPPPRCSATPRTWPPPNAPPAGSTGSPTTACRRN